MQARISRRRFLKATGGAGMAVKAGMVLPWQFIPGRAFAYAQSPNTIPLFSTVLRGVGPGGIPVALPDATPAPVTGVTHYTLDIRKFTDPGVVPNLGPTTVFGYHPAAPLGGAAQPPRHLGGIVVGQRGTPIQITFRNQLATSNGMHIIPNDLTIPGANLGNFRTATHFHGGLVPWISDGGPMAWWDPAGARGPSFVNNQLLNPGAAAHEAEYYYPLNQSARLGWYHDHAIGITRINAYAGLASAILIRDAFELNLVNLGLPRFVEAGGNEIPLVIQDKIFVGPGTTAADPTWPNVVAPEARGPGSLWYAHVYERNRWKSAGNVRGGNLVPPNPSVIPEFFGDTMLVNGTAFPRVAVEPRRYRLRLLNACNARFLNLQFYVADGSPNGITLNALGNPSNAPAACDPNAPGAGAAVLQIGTEGGFLPRPASIPTNVPFNPLAPLKSSLVVAPAERPDVLIDFSAHAGRSIILYNDAPSPFPMGDPRNDYFPLWNVKGNPVNATTPAGFGPNSRVLMRFDVATGITGSPDRPLLISPATDLSAGIDPLNLVPTAPVRRLTLNEAFDAYGRLIQMLGTLVPPGSPRAGFGRAFEAAPTEVVAAGSTEVWEIFNATADVHPMHIHLVNVLVLNRQPFKAGSLGNTNGGANFAGPPTPPEPNETGWKETVMMFPGTVTRIIMRFDLPLVTGPAPGYLPITTQNGSGNIVNGVSPPSPRTGGHEYVWHCHILEHEEHDMMRPLIVQ